MKINKCCDESERRCFSVRSVCPRVMLLGLVGIWRAKAGGSTWRAKRPPASPASCGWGFPVLRPVRHWGAMASWGPSLQLWLSPPGTCRTLKARREGGRECEFGRGCGQNVAGKFSEREIYVVLPSLVTPSSTSSPFCWKTKTTMSHQGVDAAKHDPLQTTTNQGHVWTCACAQNH